MKNTPQVNVARIEDLPYNDSPPVQFVYESTAVLNLGQYIWNDAPGAIVNNRVVLPNALYYLREISLTADTSALDFTNNIVVTPLFQFYLRSDASSPRFREAIQMNKFYESLQYRYVWSTHGLQNDFHDVMLAAFTAGTIVQGPAFIGKPDITLKAVMTMQEIKDVNFINAFKRAYPDTHGDNV